MTSLYPSTALVVVDPSVRNYQDLIATVSPDTEVIVLDVAQDGIEQITQALRSRSGIESLHILSHGAAGELFLGNTQLNLATLRRYSQQLQQWAEAITNNADMLLYGCRVAAGAIGQRFVQQLSQLTGANVAASTNLTGHRERGGDWILEYLTGEVKTPLVFAADAMEAYPHVLVSTVFLDETFRDDDVSDKVWLSGVDSPSSAFPFLTARPTVDRVEGGLFGNPGATQPFFPPVDPLGEGALRLTNATTDQAGFVLYGRPFSSTAGLRVNFDLFAYGGTGADGISFFLIDGSQIPTTAGAFGGSLGYAQRTTPVNIFGLQGGYFGLGFDEFGNYSNPIEGRVGGPGFTPDSIAIRGSEQNAYRYVTGTPTLPFSIDVPDATTREQARRNVEINLTPAGLLSVQIDANQDGDFDDPGETPPTLQNVDITTLNGGLPETFTLGFAASTGDATNIHEIRNLLVTTFTNPPETSDAIVPVQPNTSVNVTGISATDTDGAVVSYTVLTTPPPEQGALFLGDPATGTAVPLTAGQVLAPEQITQVFFQPAAGFTGGSFEYTATDNLNAVDDTPATVSLVLQAPTNLAPVAGNFDVSVDPGVAIDLPSFVPVVSDPDGTVQLIKITSLPTPEQGELVYGDPAIRSEAVTLGETLTLEEANQIFFVPAAGFTGGSFTYVAVDNQGALSPNATVGLLTPGSPPTTPTPPTSPTPTNTPPTAGAITVPINPDAILPIPALPATDTDGTVTSLTIASLPAAEQGTLFLGDPLTGGTPVISGQVIPAAQADNLFFQATPGFTGGTFSFFATDNLGAISTPAAVTLESLGISGPIGPEAGCREGVRRRGNNRRNRLIGTANRDTLLGLARADRIRGRECNDMLDGGGGRDTVFGGKAGDMLMGRPGNDRLNGNEGDDRVNAGLGNDRTNGGSGDDIVLARRGNDRIDGKTGDDFIAGEKGNDRVRGGANNDRLEGRQDQDTVRGGNGNDAIEGNLGDDRLLGNQKDDVIRGGKGNDRIRGNNAADQIYGERNSDVLYGGSQGDVIVGGGRGDTLIGGGGNDTLRGGPGADVYLYNNASHGVDIIEGFQVERDKVDLSRIFSRPGYDRTGTFAYIKQVNLGSDALIRVDSNGDAEGGLVDLARIQNVAVLELTARNFIV